jgi:hypothetical protein
MLKPVRDDVKIHDAEESAPHSTVHTTQSTENNTDMRFKCGGGSPGGVDRWRAAAPHVPQTSCIMPASIISTMSSLLRVHSSTSTVQY